MEEKILHMSWSWNYCWILSQKYLHFFGTEHLYRVIIYQCIISDDIKYKMRNKDTLTLWHLTIENYQKILWHLTIKNYQKILWHLTIKNWYDTLTPYCKKLQKIIWQLTSKNYQEKLRQLTSKNYQKRLWQLNIEIYLKILW